MGLNSWAILDFWTDLDLLAGLYSWTKKTCGMNWRLGPLNLVSLLISLVLSGLAFESLRNTTFRLGTYWVLLSHLESTG